MTPTAYPQRLWRRRWRWLTQVRTADARHLASLSDHLQRDIGLPRGVVNQRELRALGHAKRAAR